MDILKDFYDAMGKVINTFVDNPYLVLLGLGILLLIVSVLFMITRHNYTRIVNLIDEGEEEAKDRRVEEWGEMIVNNLQQVCMERKLSLTLYSLIFPIFALAVIAFSVYKLNIITNIVILVIHLILILIIFYILKHLLKKKKIKNNQNTNNNNLPK